IARGANAVLIKGGHAQAPDATDLLVTRDAVARFTAEKIDTDNTHGTGCTLSAAIAAGLAKGATLADAVAAAKAHVTPPLRAPPARLRPVRTPPRPPAPRPRPSSPRGGVGAAHPPRQPPIKPPPPLAHRGEHRGRNPRRTLHRTRPDQALAHGHLLAEAPAR